MAAPSSFVIDGHVAEGATFVDLTGPVSPRLSVSFLEAIQVGLPPIPSPQPIPVPIPLPFLFGSRFLIWKQDPTVAEPGIRTVYISDLILTGPRDARIATELPGITPVARNVNADFIFTPGTPQFDCAHTWAVVRETLTMFERLRGGVKIPWAWNTAGNTDVLTVMPQAGVTPNAYYSRGQKALKFFYFTPPPTPSGPSPTVFTCRSLDIVAHETGHAVLDGLKPGWIAGSSSPQTGGLHEAMGDISAILLALSQMDQVEAVIALSRGNLHNTNFIAALAEQFGAALGRTTGLRNADNNLKLSEVGNEVHAISQVFTGAIYDILADIYLFEWMRQRAERGPAFILHEVAHRLGKLLVEAIVAAPAVNASYADVANKMLVISAGQNDPPIYRTFIRNRFIVRQVLVSPTPMAMTALEEGRVDYGDAKYTDGEDLTELEATDVPATLVAPQDRSRCCGTMQLPEFTTVDQKTVGSAKPLDDEGLLAKEVAQLAKEFK
jgi:hypothetical protein